ncbi:tetraspanin-32 isoform X1 [Sturnira hondurensis]|uniref:tetraspanin-32 isoform X1 n=1 Tax=Sturnira hondurensis TaxID=192404 RepID=UPI00187A66DA|nr:tetraspanin-32 isoform X1 [Sturnira hondurensis]
MGPWSRVRVAKCQMLVTSFFVLLLGLLLATVAALSYFGAHFAVIRQVSPEGSPSEALHRWAFFTGVSLAGLLCLGAVLSAAAAVREAGRLMAAGFLCFALVFCALVQVAFWRLRNPTQVEDAALDTYDLAYDRAVRSSPGAQRQELLAIQDTFLCCGKGSPSSLLGGAEVDLCPGEEATSQDCLQGIRSFLRTHEHIVSILASVGLASTLRPQLGPQGDLRPEPPGPWPAALGAQLLQTLPGGAHPSSARRPGPQIGQPPAAPGPLMLYGPPARHLSAHRGTDAPASGPLCPS